MLTDGEVTRVGSTRPRTETFAYSPLLIAISKHVRENLFREDLYYRVAIFPISIPPLRERKEDIPKLCEDFLRRAASELKVPRRRITEAALRQLMIYDFPGNIRELRNLIERACILVNGEEISSELVPAIPRSVATNGDTYSAGTSGTEDEWISSLPETVDLRTILNSLERRLIQRALTATGGAQAEAARRLGLSRSDLGYKLSKHEINATAD